MWKMCTKSYFQINSLIFVNNPKHPLHAQFLLRLRYFERGLSKSLKKRSNLFFLLNRVPFNGQSYQKQKGLGTSDQSLFILQNKFRKVIF